MAENVYQAFVEYKTSYDASVTITPGANRPAPAQPAPAPKEEPAPQPQAQPKQDGPTFTPPAPPQQPQAAPAAEELYGVQVLASSRLMKDNDPYFLGYEVTRIRTGNLYKYIIGVSNDLSEARRMYSIIRQKYKDAFLVVVKDGSANRL